MKKLSISDKLIKEFQKKIQSEMKRLDDRMMKLGDKQEKEMDMLADEHWNLQLLHDGM